MEIKDLINLSAESTSSYHILLKKLIAEHANWDNLKDVRLVSIKLIAEQLQSYHIMHNLIRESFKEMSLWENQDYSQISKEKFLEDRLYFLTGHLKEGVLYGIFVHFEHFIRIIGEYIGISNQSINALTKTIIDVLNIDDKYKSLVDIFTYTRNTMHYLGIHKKPTTVINYENKDYQFTQDHALEFLDDQTLHFIFIEISKLMEAIIYSQEISTPNLIEHSVANMKFIYED